MACFVFYVYSNTNYYSWDTNFCDIIIIFLFYSSIGAGKNMEAKPINITPGYILIRNSE